MFELCISSPWPLGISGSCEGSLTASLELNSLSLVSGRIIKKADCTLCIAGVEALGKWCVISRERGETLMPRDTATLSGHVTLLWQHWHGHLASPVSKLYIKHYRSSRLMCSIKTSHLLNMKEILSFWELWHHICAMSTLIRAVHLVWDSELQTLSQFAASPSVKTRIRI